MGQKRRACRNLVEESQEGKHLESTGVEASMIYKWSLKGKWQKVHGIS